MFATRVFTTMTRLTGQTIQQMTRAYLCTIHQSEMAAVTALVDAKIERHKVMVFSKSYCPFCMRAKEVFEQLIEENKLSAKDYEVMEIEDHPYCDSIQEYLGKLTGAKSVPRVFINKQSVGGGDEVAAAYSSGELVKRLS